MKNVSVEGQKRLKGIATKMKVKPGEVQKIFSENLEKIGDVENAEKLAINRTMSHYRRDVNKKMRKGTFKPKAKAEAVYGILIGTHGMRDFAQEIREKAKRYVKKNSLEEARTTQLIDGDNRVLDTREKIFGKTNPDYLEPLPENLKLRNNKLIGLFRENGNKDFKYTVFNTSDNQLARAWTKVKNFTPCMTFGIIKERSNNELMINSSKAENTTTIFKAVKEDWDVKDIILKTTKPLLTKIAGVEKHYEGLKKVWSRFIIVRGIVNWIGLDNPTPWGAVWMRLIDPDSGLDETSQVRVLIPTGLAIDFGEGSEVLVFGKTKRNTWNDRETGKPVKGDVSIDVYGVYPIPGLTTTKEKSESLGEEEEIDGWLD